MIPISTRKSRPFKSLRHFVRDGLWSSVCEGVAESNFNAFAVFLSASAAEIGFLTSGQQLTGVWFQLWSEWLIARLGSRKRLVLLCVLIQSLLICAMTVGAFQNRGLLWFFLLAIVYTAFGNLSSPAWNAWISDLLPERRRGVCFAIRNQRTYPASFISIVLGGVLLDQLGTGYGARLAFCAVFAIGFAAKCSALHQLWKQQEHPLPAHSTLGVGPLRLLREAWACRRTRRIAFFFGAMAFAINLSGPFQIPYLLKTLNYSYTQITFLMGVMAIGRFLAAPAAGRMVDSLGSRRLLTVSSILMPFSPLGWCLTRNYYALVAVFFFSGTIWAAFDLCAFTYLAECAPADKRPRLFAAKQLAWNLLAFAGAATGGILLESQSGRNSVLLSGFGFAAGSVIVFWAGAVARTLAALSMMRFLPHLPSPEPASVGPTVTEPEPRQALEAA